ncbi:hypothetical protein [uncultured Clostridium sp.]|uniref:hypothetical protein n=1 Tax=uncultured Clostridium sp. TaxID=59620 RepID=UPI0028E37AA8|nr:hypothetical protein [uncultured Clostridium sp.]
MKKIFPIICLVIGLLFFNVSPASAAEQYINWETEPNNYFETPNYLLPYSYKSALNKGYIQDKNDIDIWFFFASEKNYRVVLEPPYGSLYDVAIWEKDRYTKERKLVANTREDNFDIVKYIDLPGIYDDGVVREYYIVVHSIFPALNQPNEPYMLVIDDTI